MANSLSDKIRLKLIALGGVGSTIADLERSYYSGVSGLPAQRSITDHKRAFWITAAGLAPAQSLTDLEFKYWIFLDPTNNVGSRNDRAMKFYV
jgi:hypothetical protein